MIKPTDLPPIPDGHPHVYPATPAPTWKYPMPTQPSIDLRDWFAGLAMHGFLSNKHDALTYSDDDAKYAYMIADAMMKARDAK